MAIDIGDRATAIRYKIEKGSLVSQTMSSTEGADGKGYEAFLRKISRFTADTPIPVGISFAGLIRVRPSEAPNLSEFMNDLSRFDHDNLAGLFSTKPANVYNDAVAGLMAASIEGKEQGPKIANIIYFKNEGGLGGAVLQKDRISSTEPGHIRVIDPLNPYQQNERCNMYGAEFTCVERVAANNAGIKSIYNQNTGEQLTEKEIAGRYMQGSPFAAALYDNSAQLTAHAIKGIANAFDLLKNPNDAAIVADGEIFKMIPGYTQRVSQILKKDLGYAPRIIQPGENASSRGAAIAALIAR